MKVLILSCNTGGGHNAAARAILEEMQRRGLDARMEDALRFGGPKASRIVSEGYVRIAKDAPALFGGLYRAGGLLSSGKRKSPVYYANALCAGALAGYIRQEGFDAAVCPHLFPAEALTRARRDLPGSFRFYAVATDYTCIPFMEESRAGPLFHPARGPCAGVCIPRHCAGNPVGNGHSGFEPVPRAGGAPGCAARPGPSGGGAHPAADDRVHGLWGRAAPARGALRHRAGRARRRADGEQRAPARTALRALRGERPRARPALHGGGAPVLRRGGRGPDQARGPDLHGGGGLRRPAHPHGPPSPDARRATPRSSPSAGCPCRPAGGRRSSARPAAC